LEGRTTNELEKQKFISIVLSAPFPAE
jgi:hypothetical protein